MLDCPKSEGVLEDTATILEKKRDYTFFKPNKKADRATIVIWALICVFRCCRAEAVGSLVLEWSALTAQPAGDGALMLAAHPVQGTLDGLAVVPPVRPSACTTWDGSRCDRHECHDGGT